MKKLYLGLGIMFTLSACTSVHTGKPIEKWKNFESSTISNKSSDLNQSLVVFYRESDINGSAVNIYVNGNYQASLFPNAFTPITVCASKQTFTASYVSNTQFGNRTSGAKYVLPANQISYIKVGQTANGQLTFTKMDSNIAEVVVNKLPKQNQTLSRVPTPKDCNSPVIAMASLDANALFTFNRSSYRDMLPQGRNEIKAFAQQLNKLGHVSSINVSGHTDPVGSEKYNLILSEKRANTVKMALQKEGVKVPIQAQGLGKSELVVTTCDSLTGAEKIKCNQPNRRVEITVYGN